MLRKPSVDFLTRVSPKLIYGTIILAAVMGALGSPLPRTVVVIAIVFLSLYAVSIANAYAETIRDDIARKQVTSWRQKWRRIVTPGWVMAGTAVPIVFFGLAAAGLITREAALGASQAGLVVLLAWFGYIARRLSGARPLQSLWAGVTVALLGYAVVQIKLWTKYLPQVGQ